ncbi:MAG: DUF389 domain-containing protein [Bacteroidota bacterium]
MISEIRRILWQIINLKDTTDVRGTIDSIRKNSAIKGYNVWILACGAMLASIGIDTNSAPVIIGAMLISPLMSPILGIGLSVGINDRKHLFIALENFLIAVIATLAVSSLYFSISPLGQVNPQITTRIEPTILDVLIALFGGIAGIVAVSRKEITNAIPGVAIATALMPPLCVAGYGIAKGSWFYFAGAFYLFFINSVFIALATYIICRFLGFPLTEFIDDQARRKAVRWIAAFVFLIIIPSGYFMYTFLQRNNQREAINRYITEVVEVGEHKVTKQEYTPGDSLNTLLLVLAGKYMSGDSVAWLESQLPAYDITDTRLRVIQGIGEEEVSQTALNIYKEIQPQMSFLRKRYDSLEVQIREMRQGPSLENQLSQ